MTMKTQQLNLNLHLKQLEKEEQKTPKISRRKEIIQIQAKINEKEMKETILKIDKTKSWFFEKINKIDKPLARLIKKKNCKKHKHMEIKQHILNNQQVTEEIRREIKKISRNK